MHTCKDCLHYNACKSMYIHGLDEYTAVMNYQEDIFDNEHYADVYNCEDFTHKDEWVHLLYNIGKKFFRTIFWRNTIDECTVSSLTQKADKTWKIRLTSGIFRTTFEITANDIGKSIFLTREEAEKVLEKELKIN